MKRSPLIKRGPRAAAPGIAKDRREAPSREELDALFSSIGQKLREGLSSEAERIVVEAIAAYPHTDDDLASLKRLHSFTLETVGRYKESLEAIRPYEDRENLDRLSREIRIRVMTQLAIAYNNLGDHPKAVTLLKETLETAKAEELTQLNGQIHIGLARVYRKLNESNICRDHANAALEPLRAAGDWLGMAEAYREIAISYHQEGNSEEALQYFDLGIKIIGDRSAPFMLGKLYTDMSGAYSFLRRAQEGIECLERSITFFDQTEHVLNSVIAYNNLGMHLMHVGDWNRAEERIKRALDLAIESNHAHIAGILDSLGEMKILRGDLREARSLLSQAVIAAREHKREWYEAQALRNLSRCLLAEGENEKAAATARETIELSGRIGDKHYAKMAGLVLAEAMLRLERTAEFENAIAMVEASDPESDFYVFGNVQRIRGLASASAGDIEMAVHHFNRSLTIFETANDTYHIAEAHLLLAEYLPPDRNEQAMRHLEAAKDIFKKLGLDERLKHAESIAAARKTLPSRSEPARSNSVVSQLLMVRLAEATASRELLFRELMAVLQQETTAKKIVIAEMNDKKRLRPFITHGIAPSDSAELVAQYEKSEHAGTAKAFERSKNVAVLELKPSGAPAAAVLISPAASAKLSDSSPLQPLIKVVELGLDVIDLRSRERSRPAEQETGSHASTGVMPGFIHSSPAMTSLVEEIYKIRSSDVTVLVTGESGTGKELVSRAIHTLSSRKDKVFIPFNCTAVPKELAEGHLFGYKRGAFTGAVTDSPGIIRSADGGTLFLDEIGDLPLDVQPKLLRFLQEGEVQPIGEKKPIKVDVRVIAATNMPLEEKVAEGGFREDLYYRLNVIRLRVPPLRERRSEIPPMVNYYISHYSEKFNKRDVTFTPQTVDLLMVCNWEGNVRQLCNEIQRIVARAEDGDVITPEHLSPELRRSAKPITTFGEPAAEAKPITSFNSPIMPFANLSTGTTLEEAVGELEMQMIKAALSRHNWNISRVANELGLTRRGLYLKLSRYGIEKAA